MPSSKPPLSIKGQALLWLSQREHSRSELRRKLLERERRQARRRPPQRSADAEADTAPEAGAAAGTAEHNPGQAARCASPHCIDQLLDWLERHGFLSNQRFVDSRVHVRAQRYGSRRVEAELAQHGLSLSPSQRQALQDSELARAQAAWARRFGEPPGDLAARARQTRFLLQRGFAPSVVRRVLALAGGPPDEDSAA
jgi:regulatory protein